MLKALIQKKITDFLDTQWNKKYPQDDNFGNGTCCSKIRFSDYSAKFLEHQFKKASKLVTSPLPQTVLLQCQLVLSLLLEKLLIWPVKHCANMLLIKLCVSHVIAFYQPMIRTPSKHENAHCVRQTIEHQNWPYNASMYDVLKNIIEFYALEKL